MYSGGRLEKNHTYEEIFQIAVDILMGNDPLVNPQFREINQYISFHVTLIPGNT